MRKETTAVVEAVVEEEDGVAPAILNVTEDAGAGGVAVPDVKAKKNKIDLPFQDKIKIELKRYKKPYRELSFSSRIKRTDEICSLIIAACIDQKEEDDDYYLNNREFANDVLNIVKGIDDRLSIKLKYNLSSIDMPEICSLIEEDDELDNELDDKKTKINGDCQMHLHWHIKSWVRPPQGDMKELEKR